jgi:hypothetical protein
MIILSAALIASSSMQPPTRSPTSAVAQATATIRVVTGVALKLDAPTNADAPPTRETVIHSADGSTAPAKLIEFQ